MISIENIKLPGVEKIKHFLKKAKYPLIIVCAAFGVAALYVADVWALGTAAAFLQGMGTWFKGHTLFATATQKAAAAAAFDQVEWYYKYPFKTAWAWLTKPANGLSNPEVRATWLGLNGIIALAGVFGYGAWKVRNGGFNISGYRIKKGDTTHGSARWAEKKDISRVCEFGFGPGIVLGEYEGTPVRIPQKPKGRHNKNVLVIGSPGCGKSYSYVMPNIFTAVRGGESIIVTDPKGELSAIMTPYLISKGYNVKVLNLVEMLESNKKNFLDEIRTPLDADVFAQVVIATTEETKKGGDGFWDRAEQNLLKALLLYVCYDETGKRRNGTMGEIYDLIATGDKEAVNQKFERLPQRHPAYGPYMISKMAGGNMWGNIIIGLGTRLQTFQQEEIRSITGESEIDLNLPGREKCAYFVITPDTHPAFNFLSSLFFTFVFVRLIEQADANKTRRLHVPVKMLLDEFANIVSIPDFEKKIATARSRGIECHVIIQSLPQLIRVYGKDSWQEIRACCSTVVVLKVEDDFTAEYTSRQLGKTTVETSSRSREVKPLTGAAIFDERENRSVAGRLLMSADEIERMPANRCIVILPSPNDKERVPAMLRTIGYTEFPEAEELKKITNTNNEQCPVLKENIGQENVTVSEIVDSKKDNEDKITVKPDEGIEIKSEVNEVNEPPGYEFIKKRGKRKEKINW